MHTTNTSVGTPPPPNKGDRGFWLTQSSAAWYGSYAVFDVDSTLSMPAPLSGYTAMTLYAPTMLAPGGSCVEVTQSYRSGAGITGTERVFGVYDWCASSPKFEVYEEENAAFRQRYVRTYQGKPTYAVAITTPNTGSTSGQCWSANLYDYLQGGWVQKWSSCGASLVGTTAGWIFWESWDMMDTNVCPTLPSIRALDISLANPNYPYGWVPFHRYTSDYSAFGPSGYCWTNSVYTFQSPIAGLDSNSWIAKTPN